MLTKLKTFNLLLGSIANYRQGKAKLGENERSLHTPSCRENHAICTHFRCLLLGFSPCSMAPPESVQVPRGGGKELWPGQGGALLATVLMLSILINIALIVLKYWLEKYTVWSYPSFRVHLDHEHVNRLMAWEINSRHVCKSVFLFLFFCEFLEHSWCLVCSMTPTPCGYSVFMKQWKIVCFFYLFSFSWDKVSGSSG